MSRFTLPPDDATWLDRAQSTDGPFDPALGFVLCELDGESYAISGRYCGIPDDEEAARLVSALHEERGLVLDEEGIPVISDDDPPAWLTAQVSILCRFPGTGERKRYTFRRYQSNGIPAGHPSGMAYFDPNY